MKLKKIALVLVVMLMASAATTALASPFADVPADHWAYDSVSELAAAGLIEGYPDGTYGGARMMTRYEAAMVFARALNRLESQIANNNLLPELDKIKAELMAEIEAQMAAADKPVVETRVVEAGLDEEALARIRANEIATDALEGDMAYLEARMLGLLDGIRYDMNQLEDQVTGVEQPAMDEIEALIAAKIQESLLDVASGVKETTIVERVVSTTPELTREDVEFIAEALIRRHLSEYDLRIQENRDLIVGLVDWVDELDTDVAVLKDDVDGLKTSVAALEKAPQLSGTLELKGEYKKRTTSAPQKENIFTQTGALTMNIKASEATDIKAILGYTIEPGTMKVKEGALTAYRLEVASETPVSRVVVGRLPASVFGSHDFSKYVLVVPPAPAPNGYQFGGVARVDIMEDLTLDLFAGQEEHDSFDGVKGAAALSYAFMPEIGIRLTGALDKPLGAMFTNYAAGIGLFGEAAGIEYTGDFAMDFRASDKNFLAAATAEYTFEPVTVDVAVAYQEDNYKIARQGVVTDKLNKLTVEGGVATDLEFAGLGFDLAGRAYYEGGAEDAAVHSVLAFKANASATYEELFVPVTLSGQYVANKTGDSNAAFRHHLMAKLAVDQKPDLGLRYGASAAYEKNALGVVSSPNWRNIGHMTTTDRATFAANVGYGADWNGANVVLGYGATFVLPTAPEPVADNTLTHKVDVEYGFTDNVTLTLGGSVKQTLSSPVANDFGYNAGLKVVF